MQQPRATQKEFNMYARVITSQLKAGSIDEVTSIWRDSIAAQLKHSKGFKGGYMTGDRQTSKGVVITLWETEADATAVDSSGQYQQILGLLSDHLTAPPQREQFEVLVEI
jgi:heme-degrading monooxygenase HmoA